MKKVEIDVVKEIKEIFPKVLTKDLTEHERLCPHCHGLGIKIVDNIYGIRDDKSEIAKTKHFPYNHQSFSFCQHCYNGVQQLCPYCGKPYENKAYLHCDCEGQIKADEEKENKKWKETISKAKEVSENDKTEMLYCEEFNNYYDSVDGFFESYTNSYKDKDIYIKPELLWVCSKEEISIDADSVIENACDELHENAADQCDYESLQKILNEWCKEQTGTTTYYPCYKEYIKIDWNKY